MPVTVYRHPDAPILIATFTGEVNGDVLVEMFRRSAELIAPDEKRVYRISDYRQATSTALAILTVLKAVVVGGPGSTNDDRIYGVLLGENKWVKLGHDTLMNPVFGGYDIPLFEKMGDAMDYIRLMIARAESGVS
jgi:hypothetical protein